MGCSLASRPPGSGKWSFRPVAPARYRITVHPVSRFFSRGVHIPNPSVVVLRSPASAWPLHCDIMLCSQLPLHARRTHALYDPYFEQMGKVNTLPRGQSLFQVVGRFVPNQKYGEDDPQCKVYRMKIFAKNKVVARSRFWYFMGRLCRVKKANGQIVSVNQVSPEQHARNSMLAPTPPARVLRRTFTCADLREDPGEGQELWHLVPVRLAYRHAQRLQGVP